MKILKKLVIKSYTKDYYIDKLDEIQTLRMKECIHHEFKGTIKYIRSLMWLEFYTSIIDFFINSFIVLCIIIYKFSIIFIGYILWNIFNNFQIYY